MLRLSAALAVAAGALATTDRSVAQTRSWSTAASGSWTDPARWSPTDAPDTAAETAEFARAGVFNALLPEGVITVGAVDVVVGNLSLVALGAADSVVAATGSVTVGDALRLQKVGQGVVRLTAQDLIVETAAEFRAEEAELATASVDVAAGWPTAPTIVAFSDETIATLGELTIGESGPGSGSSSLLISGGAEVDVDGLRVGAAPGAVSSQLQIDDATLRQPGGGVSTVGYQAGPNDPADAVISIDGGALAEFDELHIRPSGRVLAVEGDVSIATGLHVEGGSYVEGTAATHTLGPAASVTLTDGGSAAFDGGPVALDAGQSIELGDEATLSGVGVDLVGGELRVVGGATVVEAPVTLGATASLTIAAGADATFRDAFNNGGGAFTIAAGGTATFEGDYSGAGATGPGEAVFQAAVNPGASPGTADFEGDLTWTVDSSYVAQLSAATPEGYDSISTLGIATLDGDLAVELLGGFTPAEGDAFQLLTAGSISGSFATASMAGLPAGLAWRIETTANGVTARVVAPGPPGDYNSDGVVNAADYTLWRDSDGASGPLLAADGDADGRVDAADYAVWAAAYGSSPAAEGAAVPEPASLALAAPLALARGRRQ